ncbi:MAG: hypothetical protein DMD81_20760 [Candidatus Rokuibacteriota bacterium]|nr:MAG: hypothetical protein DMD81_20760 [Candidatus Rokubacteria bacterium]
MLFNSLSYALFLAVTWAVVRRAPPGWRVHLLVLASYWFYATWSAKYAAMMFALAVMNYAFGWLVFRATTHRLLVTWLCVSVDLAVLGVFKYWNFFVGSVTSSVEVMGAAWRPPLVDLVLPLGISFFTFEFIHYLVDISRGSAPVETFSKFHVFAAFFPTHIAGPIKRFQDFVPSLSALASPDPALARDGLRLIVVGLVKKVLLADTLGPIADAGFTALASRPLGTLEAWTTMLAFSFQIYFDFSGYTDIARGSAALFGLWIPPNFAGPYLATSVGDFWRRWHISLSSWLRDYVFIPLGGSRRTLPLTLRNLLITMILGGLWHGAAWHFVVWGAFWGVVLAVDRLRQAFVRFPGGAVTLVFGWLTTQLIVLFGWVLFRAGNMAEARAMFAAMLFPRPGAITASSLVGGAVAAIAAAVAISLLLGLRDCRHTWWHRLPNPIQPVVLGVAVALALVLTVVMAPNTGAKFIYFQF